MRSRAVFIKYNSVVEAAAHYFYLVARTLTWPRDTCWAERWSIFCTFGRRTSFLASLSSQKRQKRLKRARLHTLTSAPTSDIHHHQLVMVLLQMWVFKAPKTNHSFIHLLFAARRHPGSLLCVSTKHRIACFLCTFRRLISNGFLLWRQSELFEKTKMLKRYAYVSFLDTFLQCSKGSILGASKLCALQE